MSVQTQKAPFFIHWFHRYTGAYLRRHFHSLSLLGEIPCHPPGEAPLLVCINHSSWWDVLVAFHLERELFRSDYYGVMDARQLERYALFKKMGVIGVDRTSLAGARRFLDECEQLLKGRRRSLWFTPQGEMLSNYQRPIRFQPGLGQLALRLEEFTLIHLALHYEFWDEPRPEIFASFSEAQSIRVKRSEFAPRELVRSQERRMEAHLEELLRSVQERDSRRFKPMLQGRTGVSTTYDLFRRFQAKRKGESFQAEHGQVVTPQWRQPSNRNRSG